MNVKRRRLTAMGLAFLIPALLLARWSFATASSELNADLSLPREVGEWHATQDQHLSADVWAVIEPDVHLMRLYEAPGRTPIWIYVGAYAGRAASGKGAHDPEVCYPAQGWEILESRTERLHLPGEETIPATLLEARHGARQETVLYWFQPAARWPANSSVEQLLRIYDALSGQPQYAFVRFSGPSDGSPAAARDLAEFAAAIAPAVRLAVEGSRAERIEIGQYSHL